MKKIKEKTTKLFSLLLSVTTHKLILSFPQYLKWKI